MRGAAPRQQRDSTYSDPSSLQEVRRELREGSEPDATVARLLPFHDTFRKSSLDVQVKHLQEADLFERILDDSSQPPAYKTPSWLLSGFTMRNKASLEAALKEDMRARTKAERLRAMRRALEEQKRRAAEKQPTESSSTSTVETVTQSTVTEPSQGTKEQISYLMGLEREPMGEEFQPMPYVEVPTPSTPSEDLSLKTGSMALRKANKYLRVHKIFEFFQFLIAHLLSALPDDPIGFIVDLLDKCLIYRSGLGCPPLLYDMIHLEQLFFLMDRMETGFIEVAQYKTGMQTLGVCTYNTDPLLSPDGLVDKDYFINEAYDCLTGLFNDMIRIRRDVASTPEIPAPPPSVFQDSSSDASDNERVAMAVSQVVTFLQDRVHPSDDDDNATSPANE